MLYAVLAALLLSAPLAAATQVSQSTRTAQNAHAIIDTTELKAWYDEKKPMVVLDARSKQYFNGTLLPDAKWLPSDSTDAEISAAIPSKESIVVIYCGGDKCPASGWLYDKLVKLGYKNVYEYHGGLHEWLKKGYPTIKG